MLNKLILFFVLITLITSCKEKPLCEFQNYEKIRKNTIKLNSNAEKGLNDIVKLIDWQIFSLIQGKPKNRGITYIMHEIYFDFDMNNDLIFHFEQRFYEDSALGILKEVREYETLVSELSYENTEVSDMGKTFYQPKNRNFSIGSKYNNPQAFLYRSTLFNGRKIKSIECRKTGSVEIIVNSTEVEELKKAIKLFLDNYKRL